MATELDAAVPSHAGRFSAPAAAAAGALTAFRVWLEGRVAAMSAETAVGREAYTRFLREVALVPFTPDELLAMGRQEWERAVAFEALEQGRNRTLPPLPLFADQQTQIAASARQEQEIRQFLEREQLLTVPPWLQHYLNLPLPGYLGAARLPRRDRRPDQRHAAEGERHQLHPRAVAVTPLLLPVHRA